MVLGHSAQRLLGPSPADLAGFFRDFRAGTVVDPVALEREKQRWPGWDEAGGVVRVGPLPPWLETLNNLK